MKKLTSIIAIKIYGWILIISLVPLALFSFIIDQGAIETLENEVMKNLVVIANHKEREIHEFIKEQEIDLDILASFPVIINGIKKLNETFRDIDTRSRDYRSIEREIAQLLASNQEYQEVHGFMLINPEGDLIFSTLQEKDFRTNLITGPYKDTELAKVFLRARMLLESGISDFKYYPPLNAPAAFIASPILEKEEFLGVLVAQMSMNKLYGLSQNYDGLEETGETVFASMQGKEAVYVAPLRHDPDAAFKRKVVFGSEQGLPIQKAVQGGRGGGVFIDYRGERVLAVWRYLPGLNWGMVVKMDTKEAYLPAMKLRNLSFAIFVLCLVAATTLAFYVSRRISRPIQDLRRGVQIIGSGRLDHKVGTDKQDEIGELSRAFDKMTKNLKEISVSKDYVDNILSSMTDALAVIDPEGKISTVNRALCGLLGYGKEELIGKDVSILFLEEEKKEEEMPFKGTKLKKLFKEGSIIDCETQYVTKEGSKVPVLLSGAVMRNKEGSMTDIVCVAKDITERKKSEAALKQSEKRFMDVLNSSKDAILLIDGDKFVDANDATARMLEYSNRKEFLMTHPSELSPSAQPDGQSSFDKANRMMRTAVEQGFNRFEWIHRKKTGEDFPVEVSLTPITYHGKTILHCLWRDLTEEKKVKDEIEQRRRELEQMNRDLLRNEIALKNMMYDMKKSSEVLKETQGQLIQSEKMASVGQLAAGVAHEINNPLGYIISNLETLKAYTNKFLQMVQRYDGLRDALAHKDVEKAMNICEQMPAVEKEMNLEFIRKDSSDLMKETIDGAKRIETIVLDLKVFSRVGGKEERSADINEILKRVVNLVWNEIKYTAELKQEYGPIPAITCDEQHLSQVFVNLLINASYAVKDTGGVITIKTYYQDNHACVEISDTGKGIPEEALSKIFDPFFTTKEPGAGTGLGLSISQDIVKKHGGTIKVESTVGKGTRFLVSLPVKRS